MEAPKPEEPPKEDLPTCRFCGGGIISYTTKSNRITFCGCTCRNEPILPLDS